MLAFLFKVWSLAKPYRIRLFLGVLTGIIGGLTAPLTIGAVMFVYAAVFETGIPGEPPKPPISGLPDFVNVWFGNVREALTIGVHTHRGAVPALIGVFLLIAFSRGLFSYLNVYLLQWVASRTIADLRTRLFAHLLNLSAGFYNENSSGQLISRVMSDTQALQVILN